MVTHTLGSENTDPDFSQEFQDNGIPICTITGSKENIKKLLLLVAQNNKDATQYIKETFKTKNPHVALESIVPHKVESLFGFGSGYVKLLLETQESKKDIIVDIKAVAATRHFDESADPEGNPPVLKIN